MYAGVNTTEASTGRSRPSTLVSRSSDDGRSVCTETDPGESLYREKPGTYRWSLKLNSVKLIYTYLLTITRKSKTFDGSV